MAFPTLYIDTGGSATNSGSSDNNSADLSGSAATVSGSVITLDGTPDLSGVATDGSATIRLTDATNTNQKVFKITAADDGADTVTVSVAPTGVTSSVWAIGGQFLISGGNFLTDINNGLAAGWEVIFNNSPASIASGAAFIDQNTNGDTTDGFIRITGKAGAKRTLKTTDAQHIVKNNGTYWRFENLDMQSSSNPNSVYNPGANNVAIDCSVTDGSDLYKAQNDRQFLFNCELSGGSVDGAVLGASTSRIVIWGCYIHDNGARGVDIDTNDVHLSFSIIESNTLDGVSNNGAQTTMINNTIALNGDDGLFATGFVNVYNNIFYNNGSAAGEYNLDVDGTPNFTHDYNIFFQSGSGENLLGTSANTNDLTTDPLFTDSANGDFSVGSTSPAKAAAFPGAFPGGTSTGFLDIGAVQRQEPAGGGGEHSAVFA